MNPALTRRTWLAGLAAGLAATGLAQSDRPVRFVLPNATGSGVDTITRAAQQALAKALGHPVIVENQPGAGGILGLQTMKGAAPDGMHARHRLEQRRDLPERAEDACRSTCRATSRRSRSSASRRSCWSSTPRCRRRTRRSSSRC